MKSSLVSSKIGCQVVLNLIPVSSPQKRKQWANWVLMLSELLLLLPTVHNVGRYWSCFALEPLCKVLKTNVQKLVNKSVCCYDLIKRHTLVTNHLNWWLPLSVFNCGDNSSKRIGKGFQIISLMVIFFIWKRIIQLYLNIARLVLGTGLVI